MNRRILKLLREGHEVLFKPNIHKHLPDDIDSSLLRLFTVGLDRGDKKLAFPFFRYAEVAKIFFE